MNNAKIKFIQPLYELQDVGTDDAESTKMVLEAAVIYEKKGMMRSMNEVTGVYPCYENQFQVDTSDSGGVRSVHERIADCEAFGVSFDNGVEEWTPFDQKGWTRRLMTAKSVTISVTAKTECR